MATAFSVAAWLMVTVSPLAITVPFSGVGSDPFVVYRMLAPAVALVIVTTCAVV